MTKPASEVRPAGAPPTEAIPVEALVQKALTMKAAARAVPERSERAQPHAMGIIDRSDRRAFLDNLTAIAAARVTVR